MDTKEFPKKNFFFTHTHTHSNVQESSSPYFFCFVLLFYHQQIGHRCSSSSVVALKEILKNQIPVKIESLKRLRKECGSLSLGSYTVNDCLDGGRNVKCMYYESSLFDSNANEIRYGGYAISELKAVLGESNFLPESILWLLLTSQIPSPEQICLFRQELQSRSSLPEGVEDVIKSLPKSMNVLTQLSIGLLACQPHSVFVKAHRSGTVKSKNWESTLEDSLDIVTKLPTIAAVVYRNSFKNDGANTLSKGTAVKAALSQPTRLSITQLPFSEY